MPALRWQKFTNRKRMRAHGCERIDGGTSLWQLLQGSNPPAGKRKPQPSKAELRALAANIAAKHNLKSCR